MVLKRILFSILILLSNSILLAQPAFNIYNGDTINRVDSKGQKQGIWMKFYPTDTVFYRGQFKNGKPVGTFIHYNANGTKQSETKYLTSAKTQFRGFYEDGRLKAVGVFVNQKKDSVWKYYWENDSLSSIEIYKNGVPSGDWKFYYRSGKLSEITTWVNGKKNGPHKEYFKDGVLKIEFTYRDDKRNGLYRSYYSNGIPYLEGVYKMDVRNGLWMLHDETGKVKAQDEYVDGYCPNVTITEDLMAE